MEEATNVTPPLTPPESVSVESIKAMIGKVDANIAAQKRELLNEGTNVAVQGLSLKERTTRGLRVVIDLFTQKSTLSSAMADFDGSQAASEKANELDILLSKIDSSGSLPEGSLELIEQALR